ncbi:methyl-accepting chemotaxis sensory transducer [Novosphingobium nitrogenifigens DSM 19370]|uniref:Methyl-accepting chemotaxis sensory transducer n=2 Tax=Novosphingobium nitrogenifigens TaxID=378548 RepID=F1Z6E8_9SPHN|nr:methyl-accepting chemotaxis sensory transducer [Novosphingobium nitrogenifigens DSM 19370]
MSAFFLLLAVMAAMGTFAVVKIGQVDVLSDELRSRWLPASQSLGEIHAYLSQYRIKQGDLIDAPSDRTEKLVRNAQAVIDGLLDDYAKHADTKEQKAALDQLRQGWSAYTAENTKLVQLARSNDPNARPTFQGEALDQFYGMEDNVLAMIDQDTKAATEVSNRSAQIYAQARTVMIAAIAAGLAAALALLTLLMLNIARPLARMSDAVGRLVAGDMTVSLPALGRSDEIGALATALDRFKGLVAADSRRAAEEKAHAEETQVTIDAIGGGLAALAAGDLEYRVPENGRGALAKLHVDYNTAVDTLSSVLGKIVTGCTTIQTGTMEIAAAANDLAMRSEQQASSIAETARTLNEFTGTVRITADNARQTSSRLAVARATADTVEDIAHKAVEAMRSIETSSREMSEIVNVIDGIAFQTNLLALNAGVEAARAGDSGKGFAVVANEVRALAQRSADAAKDIKALISTSTEQVGGGVSLVESSGDALRQIVGEVSAVSDLVNEIAEAAEKQASGITEISEMVGSMDRFTQQNAAMVEETSAGTRNLSEETARLVEQLHRFNVEDDHGAGSRRAPRSAPAHAPAPTAPLAVARVEEAIELVEAEPIPGPTASPSRSFHGNAALKREVVIDSDDWSEF